MKMRLSLLATLLVVAAAGIGCYETSFVLGDAASAKVDPALVGTWTFKQLGPDGKGGATLVVRDLDGKRYAMDWTPTDDGGKTLKMTGFTSLVRDISFMHATPLDEDGKPQDAHMLIRYDLDGKTLTVSQLDAGFFEGLTIDSNAALRKAIEENLTKAELYEPDVMVGEKK